MKNISTPANTTTIKLWTCAINHSKKMFGASAVGPPAPPQTWANTDLPSVGGDQSSLLFCVRHLAGSLVFFIFTHFVGSFLFLFITFYMNRHSGHSIEEWYCFLLIHFLLLIISFLVVSLGLLYCFLAFNWEFNSFN